MSVSQVTVSHIQFMSHDQEIAQQIKQQLDSGAVFADLAVEHSTCPSSQTGGDLGVITQEGLFASQSLIDTAFLLEVDQISDPIETPFGWSIVKRTA